MKFPRLVLKLPDDTTGGILLFGVVMVIGIFSLYMVRKAYQAKGIVGEGIRHEQSQRDSGIRVCKSSGGTWTGSCCNRPKKSLPRGVPKCER